MKMPMWIAGRAPVEITIPEHFCSQYNKLNFIHDKEKDEIIIECLYGDVVETIERISLKDLIEEPKQLTQEE